MSTITYKGKNLLTVDGLDNAGQFRYKNKIVTHSYRPIICAGADIYINPAIRRLVIRTEISAANIKSTTKSYYKFSIYSSDEGNYTYRFSSWIIGFRPQLIYNLYNTAKYKWYLGTGFSLNYNLNTDNSMERRDIPAGNIVSINKKYFQLKGFNMNAFIRSGFKFNERLDLSLTWDSPVESTNYAAAARNQSVKSMFYSLLVLYSFKK